MSTTIEITIQDGHITYIEQKGEELPQQMWNELNIAIVQAVERSAV